MSTLVLALNPSIDAEWRVDDVLWEEKTMFAPNVAGPVAKASTSPAG